MAALILQLPILCLMTAQCLCTTVGKEYLVPLHGSKKLNKTVLVCYSTKDLNISVKILSDDVLIRQISLPGKRYFSEDVDIYYTKPFAIHLSADHHFFFLVHLIVTPDISELLVPLPVSGLGREYFLVTMPYRYAITFASLKNHNKIKFTIRAANKDLKINLGGVDYEDGDTWTLVAKSGRPYSISNCDWDDRYVGNLTGSYMHGTYPFAVVSGSCYSVADGTCEEYTGMNVLEEFLLPVRYYGTKFLLFSILPMDTFGIYYVTAGSQLTGIKYDCVNESTTAILRPGQSLKFTSDNCVLTSTHGIQVLFVLTNICSDLPRPSIMTIIPVELFFYKYFSVVALDVYRVRVVYIVEKKYSAHIRYHNFYGLQDTHALPHESAPEWAMYWVTPVEYKGRFSIYSTRSYFGCYVLGMSYNGTSYMYHLDLKMTPINEPCRKSLLNVSPFDYIDNDCDGRIDEEMMDGLDNDNDTLIDEDTNAFSDSGTDNLRRYFEVFSKVTTHPPTTQTTSPTTTESETSGKSTVEERSAICDMPFLWGSNCNYSCKHCLKDCDKRNGSCESCYPSYEDPEIGCSTTKGNYGPWTEWHCIEDCNERSMIRKRPCLKASSCQAPIILKRPGICYKTMCPENCGSFMWGTDCAKSCINCGGECNKFTGQCIWCKPGFKSPHNGCSEVCGFNEYGINCRGNCHAICGSDCIDRKEGICNGPSVDIQLVAVFCSLFAITLAVLFYFYVCCRDTDEEMISVQAISVTVLPESKSGLYTKTSSRSQLSKSSSPSRTNLRPPASTRSLSQKSQQSSDDDRSSKGVSTSSALPRGNEKSSTFGNSNV